MLIAASLAALTVVSPGAPVVVVGNGAIQILAARLAAIRGYETTLACVPQFIEQSKDFLWDTNYPEGSLPLKLLPIAGGDTDGQAIEAAAAAAEGLIVAFDSEKQYMPQSALNVFLPEGAQVKRVSLMSRYLNGAGMGFFPKAAKLGANAEIWAADAELVAQCKAQEAAVCARAKQIGGSTTIVRAGTLKGGASGDALNGGAGEPMFLNPAFYAIGQQDVVRLTGPPTRALCIHIMPLATSLSPPLQPIAMHAGELAPPLRLQCALRRAVPRGHAAGPGLHRCPHSHCGGRRRRRLTSRRGCHGARRGAELRGGCGRRLLGRLERRARVPQGERGVAGAL